MKPKAINISERDLLDLIFFARRYCDGRATYAAWSFNNIYQRIRKENDSLLSSKDEFDVTLQDNGSYWPYAQDGQYDANTGSFEARPRGFNDKDK